MKSGKKTISPRAGTKSSTTKQNKSYETKTNPRHYGRQTTCKQWTSAAPFVLASGWFAKTIQTTHGTMSLAACAELECCASAIWLASRRSARLWRIVARLQRSDACLSNLMALFAVRRASCDRSFHNGQHRATSQQKSAPKRPPSRGAMGYSIRNLYVTIRATMPAKTSKAGSDFRSQVELPAADGAA
jgi:hypothetical protein